MKNKLKISIDFSKEGFPSNIQVIYHKNNKKEACEALNNCLDVLFPKCLPDNVKFVPNRIMPEINQ